MKKLKKGAHFTDIHFGCHNNAEQHNVDCVEYVDWFCERAIEHNVDHIKFLGDWFESRANISISTLHYSYIAAKKLNDLGIPVYFVVGNHDLFQRNTRDIFSTVQFQEFSNFTIINDPTIITDIETEPLICPFLFPEEYPDLVKYHNTETWFGHFEFKGFVVTGNSVIMKSGPEHTLFKGPKHIFSGHFHKRQQSGNVVYIGNTFPTNFGDENDSERGMMIYDHTTQDIQFLNWEDCPKYTKITISKLLDGDVTIYPNSRVKCLMDEPLSFEEITLLKNQIVEEYNLRGFTIEEADTSETISDTETDMVSDEDTIYGVDDLVVKMLGDIDTPNIDNDLLIEQYRSL
jgi:DNA repair exonuclease SbcCD nuclease subunit